MRSQNFQKLKKTVDNFKDKKVLVIGDLILDQFIWGTVSRISPEAPVPVVLVERESYMPGGAANVANNLSTLGAKVYLVGITGNDERSAILRSELTEKGIETDGIIADSSRPTTLKTRVVAHQQQVVRVDREKNIEIDAETLSKITGYVKSVIKDMDAVVIEDYGKGLITPALLKPIISLAKRYDKVISVDPKEDHFAYYKGVTVVTPNHHEAFKATGVKITDDASLVKAGDRLLEKMKCRIGLITLGENGMAVFQKGKPYKKIPTVAQEVYDVSGAGDTVIATYTLSLAAGADPIEAAYISNCAAGIVVGKVGISVVKPEELIKRIKEEITKE